MKNEEAQDKIVLATTGERLRQARERIGLSQQDIAEQLYLKVSTVRDIESDHSNPNLASTFLRGYIRSYARLVHIPEEELITMVDKQAPIKTSKIAPIQNFSLWKIQKKWNNWLIRFTWIVLFIVIGLTGMWWLNHKTQKQNITTTNQSSIQLSQNDAISVYLADATNQLIEN